MKRPFSILLFAAAALACTAAIASGETNAGKAAPAPQKPPSQFEEQTVKVEATVEKIDYETRMVTLKRTDGKTVTFKAGEHVARLNEIKPGDTVVAQYYESLMMKVLPSAATVQPGATVTEAAGRASAEEAPAGAVISQTEATVEILAVDMKAQTVTIRTPSGSVETVKARYPENLKKIKVGDRINIIYTEALAVEIEPKKAAK